MASLSDSIPCPVRQLRRTTGSGCPGQLQKARQVDLVDHQDPAPLGELLQILNVAEPEAGVVQNLQQQLGSGDGTVAAPDPFDFDLVTASRRPAVSMKSTGNPRTSAVSSMVSRVVPGMVETMAGHGQAAG